MTATRTNARLVHALVVAGLALFAVGCEKALFVESEPRSQFDRFDAVRDQRAPASVRDEFGELRPNIRGRLLSRE